MEWVLVSLPLTFLALGLPLFLVLLISAIVAIAAFTAVPLAVVPQTIMGTLGQYTLLAIPFFIFAGEVMARGGVSRRIIRLVLSLFGGVRGSLGLATVGSCELFGSMSGSSQATVAAVGRLVYPDLIRQGYGERFALGLVTTSGAIAIVIPPSVPMIVYGTVAEQSIAALFIGGIVPGLLMGLALGAYVLWFAHRRGLRERMRFEARELLAAALDGGLALGTPLIILGGIYTGFFSPTEAASVAGVYTALVAWLGYRELSWRELAETAATAMYVTAQIMLVVAAAGVFSWVLTTSGVPQSIAAAIQEIDAPAVIVLFVVAVLLLAVGCFIDPVSAILVLTPLLLPVVTAVGIDPIHFGVIMTVNLAIGMYTPPFGLNIFMSQALFNVPASRIYPTLLPFLILNIVVLIAVILVPELSLALPALLL